MRKRLQLRFIEQAATQRQPRVLESHDLNIEDRGTAIALRCKLIEGSLDIFHQLILHDLGGSAA